MHAIPTTVEWAIVWAICGQMRLHSHISVAHDCLSKIVDAMHVMREIVVR